MKRIDYTGQRFHRLTYVKDHSVVNNMKKAIFQCDCGNTLIAYVGNVKRGLTKSCGCYNKELIIHRNKTTLAIHHMTNTRLFKIYDGMVYRCRDVGCYGRKGIKNFWPSFSAFMEDMYESYQKHVEEYGEKQTTIDRIDGTKGYYKDNCRWATIREQSYNRCDTLFYEYQGERRTLAELSNISGFDTQLLFKRIYELGWSVEDAMTRPKQIQHYAKKNQKNTTSATN